MERPTLLVILLFVSALTAPVWAQDTESTTSECGIKNPNCKVEYLYQPFKLTTPVTVSNEPDHHLIPARGGKVDLGLALSGGGLRSGIFTIGVLKALFDKHLLKEVDVISSVSGGGYAHYWLLTNYSRGNGSAFGERAFNNTGWSRNTCELQSLGNMMTKSKLVKAVLARSDNAAASYEWGILRTFGNGMDCKETLRRSRTMLATQVFRTRYLIRRSSQKIPTWKKRYSR
jgi:Predicted esterase of the alpha-beta hydrolase superfamily